MGQRIKFIRRAQNRSQEDVARYAATTAKRLGQIERGEANASVLTLQTIAHSLDVDIADFFAGEITAPVTSASHWDSYRERFERLCRAKKQMICAVLDDIFAANETSREIKASQDTLQRNPVCSQPEKETEAEMRAPVAVNTAENIVYHLWEGDIQSEGEHYQSYGVQALYCSEAGMRIIREVRDVTTDRQRMEAWIETANEGSLSLLHLYDALEDLIG